MTPLDSERSVFTVQTPEQARLLQDLRFLPVLGQLLVGEASAGEVAAATKQSLKQAHHKLTRLQRAGLIEVSAERPRAGRPVKVYRTLAPRYDLPFERTGAIDLGELIAQAQAPLLRTHYAALGRLAGELRTLSLLRNGRGEVEFRPLRPEREEGSGDSTQMVNLFVSHRLPPEAATELTRKLEELREWVSVRAVARTEPGEDYLLGLWLTPGGIGGGEDGGAPS